MNTTKRAEYGTDWSNINLDEAHQRALNILEPYDFETLLLEVSCNLREEQLNRLEIKKHALQVLRAKFNEAHEILEANLSNIVARAKSEREDV